MRYHIECELPAPAASALYRGRDVRTERSVAVKLTPIAGDACSSVGSPLPAAASEALRLRHPGIAELHETFTVGQLHWAVTELVEGADLRRHVTPSHLLPLSTVLSIISAAAEALHHAHSHGAVHGDVKPANIVFDAATGTVKIVDFDLTHGPQQRGSAAYMSPERLSGEPASAASDQFALGVTFYELLCGCKPFGGDSWPQVAYRIAYERHTDIYEHKPRLPHGLAPIIDRALAKEPHRRYANLRALAAATATLSAQLRRSFPCAP
jgi:eukaryotic-like serine/threonine-protein kinase